MELRIVAYGLVDAEAHTTHALPLGCVHDCRLRLSYSVEIHVDLTGRQAEGQGYMCPFLILKERTVADAVRISAELELVLCMSHVTYTHQEISLDTHQGTHVITALV